MPDTIYKLNITQDIEDQLVKIFKTVARKHVAAKLRQKLRTNINYAISNSFKQIVLLLMKQPSNASNAPRILQPYIKTPWNSYNISRNHYVIAYRRKKRREKGHTRSFIYDEHLIAAFNSISRADVLEVTGTTKTTLSKDHRLITLSMLEETGPPTDYYEEAFEELLDEEMMRKLKNRINRYRSLVGPYFAYFLDQRVPAIIRKSLGEV